MKPNNTGKPVSRRRFLKTAVGLSGLHAVAGCSFLAGDRTPNNETGSIEPTATAVSTETPSGGPGMYLTSGFDGIQEAIAAIEPGATLVIDSDFTITDTVMLQSDVKLVGAGGTITAGPDTNSDILRPKDVSNVLISGVHIDGNRAENDGNRLIGGVDLGTISNLRITNCILESSASNAIELVDRQGGEFRDVCIANNTIRNSRNHGIILGVKGNNGSLHDIIIENNTVTDSYDAQAIGAFAQDTSEAHSIAVLGNTVDNTGGADRYGTNIAFEELANNNIAYGNRIAGDSLSSRGGIGATKDADNNIIGNNHVSRTNRSLQVQNLDWYAPEGPPRGNLVVRNHVESAKNGFYYDRLDGDLHVSHNLFTDVTVGIVDSGTNTGSNYTFYDNGSSISSSSAGLPETIGTSVTYEGRDGNTIGTASWERGGVDPGNRVSVSVSTDI